MSNGIQSIVPTSTLNAPTDFGANLSPDTLMVYLSTRLNGLDDQVNSIFNVEKDQERVQSDLRTIRTALDQLDEASGTGGADPKTVDQATLTQINDAVADISKVDANLATRIGNQLSSQGFIEFGDDRYTGAELKTSKDYIDGLSKDIESSSQMNMIHLQSIMSSRQTAIQLATNLISSLGESTKAIASNIGH